MSISTRSPVQVGELDVRKGVHIRVLGFLILANLRHSTPALVACVRLLIKSYHTHREKKPRIGSDRGPGVSSPLVMDFCEQSVHETIQNVIARRTMHIRTKKNPQAYGCGLNPFLRGLEETPSLYCIAQTFAELGVCRPASQYLYCSAVANCGRDVGRTTHEGIISRALIT